MGLIADKLNEKIAANESQKYGDTIGMITSYNNLTNTASIIFKNPNGGGSLTADNVILKISEGGMSSAGPQNRQKCFISFLGNNLLTPVITGLCNDEYYETVYSQKSNSDEGAFIVDQIINSVDITKATSPMIADWIDSQNTDLEKYNCNTPRNYKEIDVAEKVMYDLAQVDKYKRTEDGITNISTKATVKCKSNGDIDIFVSNNTGIRINPDTKSIAFFGMNMTANMKDWTINADVSISGNLSVAGKITEGK